MLVVHEWGTFTALQDSQGNAIGGINTDDEPVPDFVHRIADNRFVLIDTNSVFPPGQFQGAPRCHPDVVLRLETPVTYFYPPRAANAGMVIEVKAAFLGGWLTEYYPHAVAVAPGVNNNGPRFGPITPETTGTLTWQNVQLAVEADGPETDSHVWTAPRAVNATQIAANGESERYLFYRGVGNVQAPLSIVTRSADSLLEVRAASELPTSNLDISKLWLADVRGDGAVAFREAGPITIDADHEKVHHSFNARFADAEYEKGNLSALRASMKAVLMNEGLYADEAEAMLNTWELSYFKSEGLRLFFTVPQEWTDYVLPLELSVAADITRVMIGRIEIVSAKQLDLLDQLAREADGLDYLSLQETLRRLYREFKIRTTSDLAEFAESSPGVATLPAAYSTYLALGRFRNALILNAFEQSRDDRLEAFIDNLGLHAYQVHQGSL